MVPSSKVKVELEGNPLLKKQRRAMSLWPGEQIQGLIPSSAPLRSCIQTGPGSSPSAFCPPSLHSFFFCLFLVFLFWGLKSSMASVVPRLHCTSKSLKGWSQRTSLDPSIGTSNSGGLVERPHTESLTNGWMDA